MRGDGPSRTTGDTVIKSVGKHTYLLVSSLQVLGSNRVGALIIFSVVATCPYTQ